MIASVEPKHLVTVSCFFERVAPKSSESAPVLFPGSFPCPFRHFAFQLFSRFSWFSCRCSSPFVRFGAGAAAPVQKPLLLLGLSVLLPLVSVLSLTRASTRTWLAWAFPKMVALRCNFLVHYFSKSRCQHIVSLPKFLLNSLNGHFHSFFWSLPFACVSIFSC